MKRVLSRRVAAAALVAALVLTEVAVGATAAGPPAAAAPIALPAAPIADPGPGDEAPESADDPDDPGSDDPSPTAPTSSPIAAPTTPTSPSSSPSPAATTTPPKTPLTVTIDFDDGTADQYQTAALLKARGLTGVYFINSGRIGLTSSYMTVAQIKQLQAGGNEVGGHTVFHLHLPQQSVVEQQRQICTDRDQLLALGLRITDLAFPFGEYTAATQAVARQCGYDSVRTSEGDSGGTDTLPPANPFQLKALSSLGSTTTTKYITDAVTKAEESGGLMQVVFHRICTVGPCRSNAIRIGVFTEVLNWLAAQRAAGAIQVKTVAQAIGGALHAAVAAPRPTATLTVPNPSFETAGAIADVPSCWEHTVSGDGNVATWSLGHDAHSGAWAEHLSAATITSGVGLVVAQDEGSCAAPTTVGDRYTYSVWYRSSAPIQLVSYRRLAAGGYLSFGLSPSFPASPGHWSYATVATRPMPAGTTGISVGVAVKTAGDFTFDDFAIVDSGPPPLVSAAAVATDLSTPSAAAVAIPVAPVAHVVATARPGGRSTWVALAALLVLAALALGFIDRRLARRRRRPHG